MSVKLKPYKKDFDFSYAIGVFPTLEMLKYQGDKVISVILSSKAIQNEGVDKILEICKAQRIKIDVSDGLIDKLSEKGNCYAIGVFEKYENPINKTQDHLVLVGIKDMGNLGTICRSALGFGVDNLVVIKPATDIFNPKVIRASMGGIFQLKFNYFDSFEEYSAAFPRKFYTFMTDGQKELAEVKFESPLALVFGSEASGLDAKFHELGQSVVIEQNSNIDSFNLSVAVGIALYESRKQKRRR